MLRGNYPAMIDDKGRLKIPSSFRRQISEQFGPDLFVTSLDGMGVRIYPFKVYLEIENRLAEMPDFDPAAEKLQDLLNYHGIEAQMDKQGRVVIPPRLRESAEMKGEVAVLGKLKFLEVWNNARFLSRIQSDPLTSEDRRLISTGLRK